MRLRILLVFSLLISLPLTVFVLLRQTGLLNKAAPVDATPAIIALSLDPTTITAEVGETFPVQIKVNTQGKPVSIIQTHIIYTYEGDSPDIEVVDAAGTEADLTQIKAEEIPSLNFITNDVSDSALPSGTEHQVIIRLDGILADEQTAFSANQDTVFGTITFRANRAVDQKALRIDPDLSKVTSFDTGADLTVIPTNASITVSGSTTLDSPIITSIYPNRGDVGSTVIIQGEHFGQSQGDSTVKFGTTEADTIKSWDENSITALVPQGALSGKVSITTLHGTGESSLPFDIAGGSTASANIPRIESFFPLNAPTGATISIIGTEFGNTQGTATLSVGTTPITAITSWTNVLIEARIPINATSDVITLITPTGTAQSARCLLIEGTTTPTKCTAETSQNVTATILETTTTGATIAWDSSEKGTSQIEFGLTEQLGSTTEEFDIDTPTTEHAVELTGLSACTTYSFKTKTKLGESKTEMSALQTFTTTGCPQNARIIETKTAELTAGQSLQLGAPSTISIKAPINNPKTTFQINKLSGGSNASPEEVTAVSENFYELHAFSSPTERVGSFNDPVSVTMTFDPTALGDISPESLTIYRNDGTNWYALTNCTVDSQRHEVTCPTTQFSTFGLFGQQTAQGAENSVPLPENPENATPSITPVIPTPSAGTTSPPTVTIPVTGWSEPSNRLAWLGLLLSTGGVVLLLHGIRLKRRT